MAKKREEKVEIKDITNEQIYEGLICLDVKLAKLIDIMERTLAIAEKKANGSMGIGG
ncbi:MAG: hypothetical protein MJZ37_07045 [Bacilli bacterium]|nr:hypothetical protein [Bacilli bacterium]